MLLAILHFLQSKWVLELKQAEKERKKENFVITNSSYIRLIQWRVFYVRFSKNLMCFYERSIYSKIFHKICWEFRIFDVFQDLKFRRKKWILGYLFNLVENISIWDGSADFQAIFWALSDHFWTFGSSDAKVLSKLVSSLHSKEFNCNGLKYPVLTKKVV